MKSSGIIPDVIDSSPATTLSVTYGSDAVLLGNELTPTQVKGRPTVNWDAAPGAYYTLAMVDPDAPSRADPKFREVKHWLVGNINGSDMNTGDVIADYVGSGPPKGTGLHRYYYLNILKKVNYSNTISNNLIIIKFYTAASSCATLILTL